MSRGRKKPLPTELADPAGRVHFGRRKLHFDRLAWASTDALSDQQRRDSRREKRLDERGDDEQGYETEEQAVGAANRGREAVRARPAAGDAEGDAAQPDADAAPDEERRHLDDAVRDDESGEQPRVEHAAERADDETVEHEARGEGTPNATPPYAASAATSQLFTARLTNVASGNEPNTAAISPSTGTSTAYGDVAAHPPAKPPAKQAAETAFASGCSRTNAPSVRRPPP